MQNGLRRVVVTGMGAITPLGNSVETFWEGMMAAQSGAALITHFDPAPFDTKFACELKGFDPLDYIDRKQARRLDPFCQYALAVASQAVEDACIAATLSPEEREGRRSHLRHGHRWHRAIPPPDGELH